MYKFQINQNILRKDIRIKKQVLNAKLKNNLT